MSGSKGKLTISEVQSEIDSLVVAEIISDFWRELKDAYPAPVHESSLCAVGPLQSMIGLAVRNGHITTRPSTDMLVEALDWYAEQARLCRLIHSEGDAGRAALAKDGGERARQALAAHSAGEVVGPKAKPLIWEVVPETNKDWHDAVTPFVTYRMRFIKKFPSGFAWAVGVRDPFYDFPNLYDDMSAAKAAAQADFERRILSSLTEGK